MFWPKLDNHAIRSRVFDALSANANYRTEKILGLPGTYLDTEVFYDDAPFLKDAPFLSALVANPNHIGCHTLGDEQEEMFKGTQALERDVIRICAEEIFKAQAGEYDGYVASGGTEANIEALWIYRNYFMKEFEADPSEIVICCSADTHYSIHKAANLLNICCVVFDTDHETRSIKLTDMQGKIADALDKGQKYFIPVMNLGTTMFGSVDEIEKITNYFSLLRLNYKLHVDAAYGGFIYPFSCNSTQYSFLNPNVSSVSMDAHKMLQAPYGTGIFLIRKDLLKYARTPQATYVKGTDYTICGSRSGANAVCAWMILHSYGSAGWMKKMNKLLDQTTAICRELDQQKIQYFRHPSINIIAIKSRCVSPALAKQFYLVPDDHEEPQWYKLVIMDHVKPEIFESFLRQLSLEQIDL